MRHRQTKVEPAGVNARERSRCDDQKRLEAVLRPHYCAGTVARSRRGVIARFARIVALGVIAAVAVWLGLWMADDVQTRPDEDAFVRADGRQLVRNGTPFRFRSVGFANDYSLDLGEYGFSLANGRHHSERDFERVAELGFNSVRFAINGNWYRDDPRAFWRWLDRNLGWAEAHGVLLILDLHVPIGGFWLDASEGPGDFRIWTDDRIRAQNIDLWRRIAQRYHGEPTIAAYDILNEPVTTDATGDEWRRLAAEMAGAIRAVDPDHLLIVGPVYGTERAYRPIGAGDQFLIDDANVMYDFHFYEPIAFTHQTAGWLARPIPDGGRYPDPDLVIPTGAQVLLPDSSIMSQTLLPGDSGWRKYQSAWVAITDPGAVAALPTATMRSGARGTVWFDDLEVFEHDLARDSVARVLHAPLASGDTGDWWEWGSGDPQTFPEHFARVRTDGANDDFSLKITGDVAAGDYLGWSSDPHWFKVTPGNRYRISGYMKGAGVDYASRGDEPGFVGLTLDVYADPAGAPAGFLSRGPDYLALRFLELHRFGVTHDVAMSVMEFGTIRETFEVAGKGGALWVADMLDLFDDHGVSYSLWNYHGPSMGLFLSGPGSAPGRPNQPLIDVMKAHQRSPGG